jgi:hypothetical protein
MSLNELVGIRHVRQVKSENFDALIALMIAG